MHFMTFGTLAYRMTHPDPTKVVCSIQKNKINRGSMDEKKWNLLDSISVLPKLGNNYEFP